MAEWQPIDTAPRNKEIICRWHDGHIESAEIDNEGDHWLRSGEVLPQNPIEFIYIPQ